MMHFGFWKEEFLGVFRPIAERMGLKNPIKLRGNSLEGDYSLREKGE